jgi:hypothetical protein
MPAILGQWFECTGHHSLLFDSNSTKDFNGLRFQLQGGPHNAVVRCVTTLSAGSHGVAMEGVSKDAMCFVSNFRLV